MKDTSTAAPASGTRKAVPDDVRLLTTRETCEALGCGARTLWTWGALGLIRPVRVGKRFVRYPLSEVRRFIKTQGDRP